MIGVGCGVGWGEAGGIAPTHPKERSSRLLGVV